MRVEVDDREPLWVDALLVAQGFDVDRKRLKVGDYVCGGVVVERKTVDDLCGSIVDGRLKGQVEKMKGSFDRVYVLVSGSLSDRRSAIHINSVLGMMVSLLVDDGVQVMVLENDEQLFWAMKRLFERCGDGEE